MQKWLQLATWFNFTLFCSLKTKRSRKVVGSFLNNDRAVESYWFMTLSWNDCWGTGEGQHAISFVRTERVVNVLLGLKTARGLFSFSFCLNIQCGPLHVLLKVAIWRETVRAFLPQWYCLTLCMLDPVTSLCSWGEGKEALHLLLVTF